jgi:fermentation-respiration switch protein FrsA (DUF1100 family)
MELHHHHRHQEDRMAEALRHVTFKNGRIDLAGDLHLPAGFSEQRSYAAIVIVTPGSSVKGQIGAVYGSRLADEGFIALAFDPSFQGESGGEPRDLEDPASRIEDVRSAIDYLVTLPFIGENRIAVLGICAGGGYAVSASLIEHRIKAIGTVVPVNIGRAFRQAHPDANAITDTLVAAGRQRTAEARGEVQRREPWLPDTPEAARAAGIEDRDTLEAIRYYRTPRGYDGNSTNRLLFRSNAALLGFDAFHLVPELLTQPLQVVVGGRLGTTFSYQDGKTLWEQARHKEAFHVIDGAGHYELYDTPEYVTEAMDRLASFYRKYLGAD